jgi:RNA polymerase sigma-70 factor (ECF subfamily)
LKDEGKPEEERAVEAALAENPSETTTQWLEPIYREHATVVLRAAHRVTGNLDDAEDVLQTVFTRLARRDTPLEFEHNPLPYLRRAATNAALDIVQSRYARSVAPLTAVPDSLITDRSPAPDRLQMSRELQERLRSALNVLSRRHAEIFVLRYFEGLDNQTIAEQFDTSPNTVSVTLHRVRARLAKELGPEIGGIQ